MCRLSFSVFHLQLLSSHTLRTEGSILSIHYLQFEFCNLCPQPHRLNLDFALLNCQLTGLQIFFFACASISLKKNEGSVCCCDHGNLITLQLVSLCCRKSGQAVLVHCKMGVSRSASTVIAYAMKQQHWPLDVALGFVRECRSIVKPNDGFMKQLQTYNGILNARSGKLNHSL